MAFDDNSFDAAVQTTLGAIFISMELSQSKWLITSLSPGRSDRMSKHVVVAGDVPELMELLRTLREKAETKAGRTFPVVSIQEAGLDGFWIHRILESEGVESYVVDPASIATSRRRRRAKTDRIDGESLLRTLLAYKRRDPRVCSMVVPPTPEEEDLRRNCRERRGLIAERVSLVNRLKGLLYCQGIRGFDPLKRDRRERLEELMTGDGRSVGTHLRAQIDRILGRIELILDQLKLVEKTRDALVAALAEDPDRPACPANLMQLRGVGPDFASVIWSEGLYRHFDNRRQLASYAGLSPTPWQSGSISNEQGISKSGNPRLQGSENGDGLWRHNRGPRRAPRPKGLEIEASDREDMG